MSSTFLDGQQNLASLSVPGVYVDIIPPQPTIIGAPTNRQGLVGVASWGPLNAPQMFSTPDECASKLGVPIIRKYDLASYVWAATNVGKAIAFAGIRVSDGTDTAATVAVQTNCLTLTGKYTGTRGNLIKFRLIKGTAANSYSAIIAFPGRAPEVFNNIKGSGNALWVAIAAAINGGNTERGPSNCVVAAAGAGTTAPTLDTDVTLTGGTDGASIADTNLIGSDVSPRTGMYALRRSGVDAFTLCDLSDATKWGAIDAFALSESCTAIVATTSGDTISSAVAARTTNGLDDFPTWLLVGDYPTFYDSQNGVSRLVSPAAFGIGILGNLSPELSPLNKQLRGISQTQTSQTGATYSDAELAIAENGGVDLIVGPPTTPGGDYYTFITGRNASSNGSANGIEYTRMTNFLARSFQSKAAGSIVGRMQSIRPDDQTRADAKALIDGFLASIQDPAMGSNGNGMIDQFYTQCDLSNNPPALQARGFLFLYAAVRYLNVVRYFVIKLAGGGNVQITTQLTPPTPAQFV